MVHKPKHKVHSFRGLLGDGGQDEINLERQNVNLAYRITTFQVISQDPVSTAAKSVIKIYKEEQTLPTTSTIDFTETDLLGVGVWTTGADATVNPQDLTIIFDNTLFSRNIWITHQNKTGSDSCNYYIEIEEVPVTASTLMQIKLGTARKLIGAKMGG